MNISSLKVGDRVFLSRKETTELIGNRIFRLPVLELATIASHSSAEIRAVGADGAETLISYDAKSFTWRLPPFVSIHILDYLPDGADDQILRFALPRIDKSAKPILLHVESIETDRAIARLVDHAPTEDVDVDSFYDAPPWTGVIAGGAAIWSEPVVVAATSLTIRPGDLLTAIDYRCDFIDGVLVTRLIHPIIIGAFPDLLTLGAFLKPLDLAKANFLTSTSLGGYRAFIEETYRGQARSEPDEALVLWRRDGDSKVFPHHCACLAHTGIVFHSFADSIDDYLYSAACEPGLWIIENATAWSDCHDGEYDCGIEGDWRPATSADIDRFGFTLESIEDEIRDRLEIPTTPGIAVELMQLAETAAAAAREKSKSA